MICNEIPQRVVLDAENDGKKSGDGVRLLLLTTDEAGIEERGESFKFQVLSTIPLDDG